MRGGRVPRSSKSRRGARARALASRAPSWAELTSSALEKGLEPRHRRLGATAVEQLVLAARAGRATLAGRGWWTSRRGVAGARPLLGPALPARGRRHAGSAAGDPQRRGGGGRRGAGRAPTELCWPPESPESTIGRVRKRTPHLCYVALWRQNERHGQRLVFRESSQHPRVQGRHPSPHRVLLLSFAAKSTCREYHFWSPSQKNLCL